ncbi:MAG: SusC/RagA family TonB-linked outer membrane protein [Gemmatimonadetes bacterium]|nr:SusC/RagA family TonB-linked outer membrane protein [Gemmatimonadota bacterium]
MMQSVLKRATAVLVALATIALPGALAAQGTGTVEGTVIDAASQRPLANVQVSIQGTGATVGALTSAQGTFRIPNVAVGSQTVRARLIGYAATTATVNVTAGGVGRVSIELRQSAIELSAVVTTGTGGSQVEARKLGNTVAAVEMPTTMPVADFSTALQGREPGLMLLPSSGTTGEGSRIRIRGNASLSQNNEPIVYVDGVRIDNGGGFSGFVGTGGGGRPSRLDDINPASIEKVEVLKGAAAATLYGTEASAGVILITTKKGAVSNTKWSLEVDQTAKTYPKGRIENQYGFAGRTCGITATAAACADTQAARLATHFGYPITRYQVINQDVPTQLFETGKATTVSGQVTGGTPISTYFASARAYREDGPFTANNFNWPDAQGATRGVFMKDINNKYQGTMAIGLTPSKDFKLQFNSLFSLAHNEIPQNNNSIYAPYTIGLFSKPENAQCDASKSSPTDPSFGSMGNGLCKGSGNPTGASAFGSQREMVQETVKQDARHYNGSLRASYIPSASLNFDATFGIDYTGTRSTQFLGFGNNLDLRINRANNGFASVDNRTNQVLTLSVNGGWTSTLPFNTSSNLVFGGQGYVTQTNTEGGNATAFPGPGIEVLGGAASPQVFESFASIVNTGFFAQEQLGWRDWIFATVGGRYDYNSAFGKTSGGVLYPQTSFSLVLSDRAGYADSFLGKYLSTFRIRGAFGQAGRQPGAFDKLTTYLPLTAATGPGLVPGNLGNPELKPEISTELEFGAEFGLFNDNVSVDVTRWQRTLKDALVARQFPVSGGFRSLQLDNIGEMRSFGYDVKMKAYLVNRANLSADVFASTAFLSQLVTSMGGAPPLKVGGSYPRYRNFIKEGYAPGTFFGARLPLACPAGRTTAFNYSKPQAAGGPCLQAGQLPVDLNGNRVPDTEAEVLAYLASPRTLTNINPMQSDDNANGDPLDHWDGKPLPDFEGAFGGSLTWRKNWRVSTNFEYRAGNYTISNLTRGFRTGSPTNGGNTERRATVEMTMMNPASTPQQRLDAAKEYWASIAALSPYDGLNQQMKGDFIRWRELSLTYTAPASWASKVGGSDLSMTFAARNFMMWTKYKGVDPEINVYGRGSGGGTDQNVGESIDAFGFPIPKQISFNIRVGF